MVIYQDLMGVNGIQCVFSDLPWFFFHGYGKWPMEIDDL
jgi:hypothetical protein